MPLSAAIFVVMIEKRRRYIMDDAYTYKLRGPILTIYFDRQRHSLDLLPSILGEIFTQAQLEHTERITEIRILSPGATYGCVADTAE